MPIRGPGRQPRGPVLTLPRGTRRARQTITHRPGRRQVQPTWAFEQSRAHGRPGLRPVAAGGRDGRELRRSRTGAAATARCEPGDARHVHRPGRRPARDHGILSFRFRPPTLANGDGNRWCCVRSSSSSRRPTPTLSQGIWATTTRHRARWHWRCRAWDPGRRDPYRDAAVSGGEWHTAVRRGDRVAPGVGSADSSSGPWCNGNRVTVH